MLVIGMSLLAVSAALLIAAALVVANSYIGLIVLREIRYGMNGNFMRLEANMVSFSDWIRYYRHCGLCSGDNVVSVSVGRLVKYKG